MKLVLTNWLGIFIDTYIVKFHCDNDLNETEHQENYNAYFKINDQVARVI